MSLTNKLQNNLTGWVSIAITIVIGSVILLKFKGVSGVTAGLNDTVDAFVTALSEPKNWVSIVIIAMIGFAVLYMFTRKRK
jgi:hypothetical protein